MIRIATIAKKTIRTNGLPRVMAIRAPKYAPRTLHNAMSKPSVHRIEPEKPKTNNAAALVPKFTILAVDEAARNEYPKSPTSAINRKDPGS